MNLLDYTGMKDKNGIPICVGDLIKIFHFTGMRRKKHYLYRTIKKDGDLYVCKDILSDFTHRLCIIENDRIEVLDGVEFNFNDVTYFWRDRKRKAVSELFLDQTS